jgi:hypothetical protein
LAKIAGISDERRSSGTIVRNKKPGAVIPPGLGRALLDRAFLIKDSVTRVN